MEALPANGDASAWYLARRLALVQARVEAAVARRRAVDPDPDDRFRGLYVADRDVDALLASTVTLVAPPPDPAAAAAAEILEAEADRAEAGGAVLRLRRLAAVFDLSPLDIELLLVAVAPDLDRRFERLYGYLNDDVSFRRASVGLALELCGVPELSGPARARLGPTAPLVDGGLLLVEEPHRPFLTRALRVPDRVTAHLLGDDTLDDVVLGVATPSVPAPVGDPDLLARPLAAGVALVYLREAIGGAGRSYAAAAARRVGMRDVSIDLRRVGPGADVIEIARRCAREAQLTGAILVAGPVEVLAERGTDAVQAFAEMPAQVVLLGAGGWDPGWTREVPLTLDAPVPGEDARGELWMGVLGDVRVDPVVEPTEVTRQFRLAPEQMARAAFATRLLAEAHQREATADDLRAGARAQNAAGLERLARRIDPKVTWDDLVLPAGVLLQLEELVGRVRQRDRVWGDWHMGGSGTKGRGVKALFAGESGTGKTVSAEAMAKALGLDLYVIDLSTVVDKYVGETEKNLDRIFAEADRVNGVLLFDEADALFGKRSEVRDAQDRYANVEVAYLLQRVEQFEGMAVLTTNLRANLDEAFARRLDAIVDFPEPDIADRRRLWELHLPPTMPRDEDVDVDFLARAFELTGGSIRNICLTAGFLAAEAGHPVRMVDMVRATELEYRKLGHLLVADEFGPYHHLVVAGWR